MKKVIAVTGVALLTYAFAMGPIDVHAEKNLSEIQKERKEIKEDLTEAEKEVADILIEIEEKSKEIIELDKTLEANTQAKTEVQEEMDEVNKEIQALEDKIEERFTILQDRAKSYQKTGGNMGYLEVLFGAEDFNDFISRVNAVTAITDSDANLIKEQEEDKRKVEMKLEELEELEKELLEIEKLVTEQKEHAVQMKEELEDKNNELNKLVHDLELKDEELNKLENKFLMASAPASGGSFNSADGNGILGWPTEGGYISSHMGKRWGKMHKGIDIARTDRSTSPPIFAAESGTVETAGTLNGYGNTVIINHGNGMKTLYGHMSSLTVSSGQKISRGEQIGVMGATGRSTGIHLHFEVHINGSIQNPISYLN